MQKNLPAVGAPLDAPVRPRAWAWKDEPSGIEVYSGWDEPRPTNGSEPLYDQAAIDAAVAAERERWIGGVRVQIQTHVMEQEFQNHRRMGVKQERERIKSALLSWHARDKDRHNYWACAVVELFGA